MISTNVLIPLIGAASAFGAAGAVLALMGAGAPFLLAALGASACAGLILYGAMPQSRSAALARSAAPARPAAPDCAAAAQARIDALEVQAASLRHDLRGALYPALIMSDRLVTNADPAVRLAGEGIVRSIERATELLTMASKASRRTAPPPPTEIAAWPSGHTAQPQSPPGGTVAPAPQPGVGP